MLKIIISMGDKKEILTAPVTIFKGAMWLPVGLRSGVFNITPPGNIDIKTETWEKTFEDVRCIEVVLPQ